jgi:DNA polymerase IV
MMTRKILHLDLDAFFCCVEELSDPTLRGKPFAVGGRPEERGVVASCSYAARQFGVRSAMPMSRAVRQCPDLIVVSHNFKAYRAASTQVMTILHEYTPLVEQLSIDEAFLDVSELPAAAEQIARQLQARINREVGLPCSLGVASNKLVAKIANNIGKDAKKQSNAGLPPNAILIVPPGEEAAFLAPLPARELWGVGPKTAETLAALGLHMIGEIAQHPLRGLVQRFGKHGHDLWHHAQGIDDRAVETERETKSVSRETTFVRDMRDAAVLHRTLATLCEELSRGLQAEGLRGTTIKIKLRWSDFRTLTRQTTLLTPTADHATILEAALRLLEKHRPPSRAVRLLGVGVSHFAAPTTQLSLWEVPPLAEAETGAESSEEASAALTDEEPDLASVPPAKQAQLRTALDTLRSRFGDGMVKRASQLKEE